MAHEIPTMAPAFKQLFYLAQLLLIQKACQDDFLTKSSGACKAPTGLPCSISSRYLQLVGMSVSSIHHRPVLVHNAAQQQTTSAV